jgi:superfamily II RNA helicase
MATITPTIDSSLLFIPDASTPPKAGEWPPSEPLALTTSYELDAFQKHAILAIHASKHVFVTAPTGSGKTFVGEYLIAWHLARGNRVFYTTPIKSLSNQKYHDLKERFPSATVGIITGDIKMCPQAQIVVMTAEILRNLLIKRGTATESVGLTAGLSLEGVAGVVMDEVHYIQDPDRGHVWEETLILAKELPDLQMTLLSATLSSAPLVAEWLANLHQKPTCLLDTRVRAVPLVHGILTEGDVAPFIKAGLWTDSYSQWLKGLKATSDAATAHKKAVDARRMAGYSAPPPSSKTRVETPMARLLRTVEWLKTGDKLPALFFLFSRRECERLASQMPGSFLDTSDASLVETLIDFHLSRYKTQLATSTQFHAIKALLVRGIGFHHSGLQPVLKEMVEILYTRGYVRILFATETFAVGLNMPTRTVVFLELEKWSDGGIKRLLRPDEYMQMAGRAGRRGIDTEGLVLYEPLRAPIESGELKQLLTGGLSPLNSQMRFHYDFLLKSKLRVAKGEDQLVTQSYWGKEQDTALKRIQHEVVSLSARVEGLQQLTNSEEIAVLKEYVQLSHDVEHTVNAKQKKARVQLASWMERHYTKDLANRLKRLKQLEELQSELEGRKQQVAEWCPFDVTGELSVLRILGFIHEDTLSSLGVMATEVNEGHPILMPMLAISATSGVADLKAEEIPIVLSVFLRESCGIEEEAETLETLGSLESERVSKVFRWLENCRQNCITAEMRSSVHSPSNYWELSASWVSIISNWMIGHSLSYIAGATGMFEGSIQRGLLRVANLLEEWGALASLQNDLATLEKLRSLNFLRVDALVTDSLYLRI